ncbi:hypothetical protein GCM10023116_46760 [Kistimonas scapharcae]|uniref:Phage tail protein n=1 Tax=Kistimonas scapharcae TaxID=1036133 RepID=A0ABP8V929_9GAMM
MAASTTARLGAGTVLSFEDPANSGTFIELANATAIGATGEQGEFVETTPISATTRTYIGGMKTPPDKEITLNDVPGDTDQEKFLTAARNGETVSMKVTFSTGRTGSFSLVLSGYQVNEPTNNEAVTVTVFGKQSGDTTWTVSA